MCDDLQDLVRQWIAKAEGDWCIVEIMTQQEDYPRDLICFHCQQYVEKLLKSLLTLNSVEIPRTHDLRRLIEITIPYLPQLSELSDRADELTIHAVQSRYPDDWQNIEESDVREMMQLSREFAAILTPILNAAI
jgi:HEPN domain-containing protein